MQNVSLDLPIILEFIGLAAIRDEIRLAECDVS
jgi:hypothetical protein